MGPGRNRAGASGRIASAGGSRTARRTAPSAPTAAAATLIPAAMAISGQLTRYSRSGKRKNWP
jgi:hypothetical protein